MKKPLTIAVITPFSYQPFRSIWQLCDLFVSLFSQEGLEVVRVTPPSFLADVTEGVPPVHRAVGAVERLMFSPMGLRGKLESLRKKARKAGRDFVVLLSDQSLAPLLLGLSDFRTAVFVNDCLSLRAAFGDLEAFLPQKFSSRFTQQTIRNGLLRANTFITPSFATANDLRMFVGQNASITVAYNPLHSTTFSPLDEEELSGRQAMLWRRFGVMPQPYFLHVGSGAWYKNRRGVLELLKSLKASRSVVPAIVFAGEAPSFEEASFAAEHGLELYGFTDLTVEELQTLYCGAIALIFPSLAEGFGWPPLEALACGTPIVVSDTPALAELYGDVASLVLPTPETPEGLEAWAAAHASVLNNVIDVSAELRAEVAQAGISYAATFTPERFRHKIMGALLELVER